MNQKILWKIEELWNKYYNNIYHSVQVCHPCKGENLTLCHCEPAKQSQVLLKKLYKNNISIYNSDFYLVEEFNFEKSKKPVHCDDYGEYFGLEKSQVLEKDEKLIYLFDNHNKIIQSFLEYAEITGHSFDVVHIDAHDDAAVFPQEKPHTFELKNVQEYIEKTRISDFFDFLNSASYQVQNDKQSIRFPEFKVNGEDREGALGYVSGSKVSNNKLIKNIHRYTKSTDFQKFKKPKNPYILSLDIDIFGPEGDFVDLESKIKIIAEAWQYADIVCIATSPGFIDQEFAQGAIEILVK